jgi:RNA polymerase sigma factor (sigma-70 family)
MMSDPLDAVLEKLCHGDAEAAERVFVAYEPYLRLVVRRLMPGRLRAKFDSSDVVQSVWADVLQGFREAGWRFQSAAQLRAFLIKATRHRFIDRYRRYRYGAEHERSLEQAAAKGREPASTRPAEVVQADELWEELLALCPPTHQDLLRLKRQGCSLADIAAQTGLHPSSVRRILYDLARDLAARQARRQALGESGTTGPATGAAHP